MPKNSSLRVRSLRSLAAATLLGAAFSSLASAACTAPADKSDGSGAAATNGANGGSGTGTGAASSSGGSSGGAAAGACQIAKKTSTCAPADVAIGVAQSYKLSAFADNIAVGDFNGDGAPDIVTFGGSGSIDVLMNKGDGTFAPVKKVEAQPTSYGLVTGDFDGDCKTDVVFSSFGTESVGKHLEMVSSKGDGSFTLPKIGDAPFSNITDLVTGDFNRDGKLDVAYVDGSLGQGITVSLNPGDGVFSKYSEVRVINSATRGGTAVGDLDGDGAPELVAAGNKGLLVMKNSGSGAFAPPKSYSTVDDEHAATVALGDVNGDGKLDAVVGLKGNRMNVFFGNGDGTFGEHMTYEGLPPFYDRVLLKDMNNDGKLDFVAYYGAGGAVTTGQGANILFNDGTGKFPGPVVTYGVGSAGDELLVADFAGNGLNGLAAINHANDSVDVIVATCRK